VLSLELSISLLAEVGIFMFVLGALSFCTSLTVWLLKSRATKIVAGVGVVICVSYVLFGYYLLAVLPAIIYWVAISQLRTSHMTETSDWHES
jgi:hypothetical protein